MFAVTRNVCNEGGKGVPAAEVLAVNCSINSFVGFSDCHSALLALAFFLSFDFHGCLSNHRNADPEQKLTISQCSLGENLYRG
jgi:hypothetical protein